MKCKSCGANYKTRELVCPYCQTENIIGKLWKVQRTEAEQEYERNRRETDHKISPYVADRILTRAIVVAVGIYALIFVGAFLYYWGYDTYVNIRNEVKSSEIVATMEMYHFQGEYGKLYQYMSDMELIGDEYYGYTQAALMNNDYERYLTYKCRFLDLPLEEKFEDDYYLEYAIRYSANVYTLDCGIYDELDPMNADILAERQLEMEAFWRGTLGMSDEDIAYITEEYASFYGDEFDAIVARVRERFGELDDQ